jgi:hypothetical protein
MHDLWACDNVLNLEAMMSSPSMGRLLISHITLRGPELGQLYVCIAGTPGIAYDDLVCLTGAPIIEGDPFGLQEAALREALNFLLVVRLVEQNGPARRRATFRAAAEASEASFPLRLLRHIAAHPDERQRAIVALYQQLVRQDTLALSAAALRDEAERGPLGSLFAWTGEKVGFWARLCGYLGLTRAVGRDSQLLLLPQPAFVLAALRAQLGGRQAAPLALVLHAVDADSFACFTARGTVHRGLAQTLVALHRLGALRLSHSSDAAQSVLLGEWRVSDVELLAREEGAS